MKLIIAIVGDSDAEAVVQSLIGAGFRVTRVASTGGFLRKGNTTLLLGAEADRIDEAIGRMRSATAEPPDHDRRRGTVFVLDIDRFEQF
ncbi:MAG: cyclic-di-AMP receptor [Actinobacteria bacterium]|nr:cyclic-di-AMP receptor [Actinomycetota bacterium]